MKTGPDTTKNDQTRDLPNQSCQNYPSISKILLGNKLTLGDIRNGHCTAKSRSDLTVRSLQEKSKTGCTLAFFLLVIAHGLNSLFRLTRSENTSPLERHGDGEFCFWDMPEMLDEYGEEYEEPTYCCSESKFQLNRSTLISNF